MKLFYDLHIHSCLSPCGDSEMTPANIAGMAYLAGLNVVAISDHNTARHCRSFSGWAERYHLLAVPAMELNTREEVHILCLFPQLEAAEDFDAYVRMKLPDIKNRPDFFGPQLILDDQDRVIGQEDRLLTVGTEISIYEISGLMEPYGGLAIPAHIDRDSNSVLANLGFVTPDMGFTVSEITRRGDIPAIRAENAALRGKSYVTNSDAHYLGDIFDAEFTLETEDWSSRGVVEAIRKGNGLGRL